MNEDFLKDLWQTQTDVPQIDFAAVEKHAGDVQNKLRRRANIDIFIQIASTLVAFVPVFFFPRMIFLALVAAVLCLWYVPELRRLYNIENTFDGSLSIKQILILKIKNMQRFLRRTRIVLYSLVPFLFPLTQYCLGQFDNPGKNWQAIVWQSLVITIVSVIAIVAVSEIYFRKVYEPILKEWENLLMQIESDD